MKKAKDGPEDKTAEPKRGRQTEKASSTLKAGKKVVKSKSTPKKKAPSKGRDGVQEAKESGTPLKSPLAGALT